MANFNYYGWIILPLLILTARLIAVTLSTLRYIFIFRGLKKIVPFTAFAEALIWLLAIAQVMKHMDNVACYLAWAIGYSLGTYLGIIVEEKLAIGLQVIRIITEHDCETLISELKKDNHGITTMAAEGASGSVKIVFTVVQRKYVQSVIEHIRKHNPHAFYTIEDIRDTAHGVFTDKNKKNISGKVTITG
ncbi:MAG TPA: DUF2179 domain-containing protein [Bacteroidia bacterium]|nr:DUF2179 domain-containing protein [Bacteroidia bacterium]